MSKVVVTLLVGLFGVSAIAGEVIEARRQLVSSTFVGDSTGCMKVPSKGILYNKSEAFGSFDVVERLYLVSVTKNRKGATTSERLIEGSIETLPSVRQKQTIAVAEGYDGNYITAPYSDSDAKRDCELALRRFLTTQNP